MCHPWHRACSANPLRELHRRHIEQPIVDSAIQYAILGTQSNPFEGSIDDTVRQPILHSKLDSIIHAISRTVIQSVRCPIPSTVPSNLPSSSPSGAPSSTLHLPSAYPSSTPSRSPTPAPAPAPTPKPSNEPSIHPTSDPSVKTSLKPSSDPSIRASPVRILLFRLHRTLRASPLRIPVQNHLAPHTHLPPTTFLTQHTHPRHTTRPPTQALSLTLKHQRRRDDKEQANVCTHETRKKKKVDLMGSYLQAQAPQ